MSVKAVEKYYKQICDQYNEMIENIHDLEDECSKGLVEPERVERLKEQVSPIKQNYERWTYMMYLLHEPQRKSKHMKYKKQCKNKLACLSVENCLEAVIEENYEAIKHVGE